MTIRIAVVDDHPMIRAGLGAVIALESDMQLVGDAANGQQAIELFRETHPDVMLMDINMPVMDGVDAIRAIMSEATDDASVAAPRIIVLTVYAGDDDIHRALDAGAAGYLLKDMVGGQVIDAVRAAARGEQVIPTVVAAQLAEFGARVSLTARELEVLTMIARGLRNREIANEIGRTEETVKMHVKSVLAKLGVVDRTEAVAVALERGIIHTS
ncbi:MAG: response regulator transcription factor [Gemmatimonadaceae bacterium]|nr:response regulator transcription factor [Gemmatimonadaceae bacterium]